MLALPVKLDKVGRPRLDHYTRLLSRLYEPLVMLETLGQTRDEHSSGSRATNQADASRRAFTDRLAYLCDFDKGGVSCIAIGVENSDSSYNFWLASSGEESARRSADFLRAILGRLHSIDNKKKHGDAASNESSQLLPDCVTFAHRRIRKESECLRRFIRQCQLEIVKTSCDKGS